MRKAPFVILASVVVFVSMVVGVLVHRARSPRPLSSEPAATSADYRVKQLHLQEQTRDGSRWQVDAEHSETFEGQGKTIMKKVRIRVEEPARSWRVTSDEGELIQPSRDVELRGNVVLVSSDGLRLETERLRWAAAEQRAWTDAPVTIYRSGVIVHGTGFESRVAGAASSVKGRVRATFNQGGGAPAEAGAPDRS